MNYNSQGLGFGGRSPEYAPCAPTNYNSTAWRDTEEAKGALRAHQRITTSIEKAQQTPAQGCAPCAPTNYNFNCTGIKNVIWAVRLARTNELQP